MIRILSFLLTVGVLAVAALFAWAVWHELWVLIRQYYRTHPEALRQDDADEDGPPNMED